MVRVIMREKTLATKCQQAIYLTEAMIQSIKIDFVASMIYRIGLPKSPGCDLRNWRVNWNAGLAS
jgi:hypothetical protein